MYWIWGAPRKRQLKYEPPALPKCSPRNRIHGSPVHRHTLKGNGQRLVLPCHLHRTSGSRPWARSEGWDHFARTARSRPPVWPPRPRTPSISHRGPGRISRAEKCYFCPVDRQEAGERWESLRETEAGRSNRRALTI